MEQPISAMRRISGASQCHGANGVTSGERIATAPGTRWSRGSARHGIAVVAVVCAVRLSGLVKRVSFARIFGSRRMPSGFRHVTVTLTAFVCLTLVAGFVPGQPAGASSSNSPVSVVSSSPGSAKTSFTNAPTALRAAVDKAIGSSHVTGTHAVGAQQAFWDRSRRLGASFSLGGAQFTASGDQFTVGRGSVGRADATQAIAAKLIHTTSSTIYGSGNVTESFKSTVDGVEQSFHVSDRSTGSGPLVIKLPISGLKAMSANNAVELRDSSGRIVASYSGLHVIGATGKTVPATMTANPQGDSIAIEVHESGAAYPLTVDPTWSQTSELTATDGTASDYLGVSVAMSGTTALVGAPYHTVSGHSRQGAAYIFAKSGGSWSETAELTASDGASGDQLGWSVALSGSVAFVGAPMRTVGGDADQGAMYEFTESGGSWSEAGEFSTILGAAGQELGSGAERCGDRLCLSAPARRRCLATAVKVRRTCSPLLLVLGSRLPN